MRPLFAALACACLASAPVCAQTSTPSAPGAAGQARPARGPQQSSVPNAAPAATTDQTTGARNQNPTVKQMNESERGKVAAQGK